MKLFMVADVLPHPTLEEWTPSPDWSLVVAETEDDALKLVAGGDMRVKEIDMSKARVLFTAHLSSIDLEASLPGTPLS